MLRLLGETTALLKQAGVFFPLVPVKHVFAEGDLGAAACKVSGWQRGSLWDLGPPTQGSFRSRALGNTRWPVYQGVLSQLWCYWESLLCWSLLTGFRGKSWENERLQLRLGR